MIFTQVYNMLRQLPPSHDSGQRMEMYLKHETGSLSCHRLMTTVRAWLFIPEVWIMLCQLPSSHDNNQSIVMYSTGMKHAPSVFIVSWQRIEHGYSLLRYATCSVSCHRLMTTVRAWLYIPHVWNSSVSCHGLITTVWAWLFIPKVMNHAPSVVIVS